MMRAITIRQPWGWAVASGLKRVENRGKHWPWSSHVGQDIAIHVGKGWDEGDLYDPRIQSAQHEAFPNPDPHDRVHTWEQHLRDVVEPAMHRLDGTVAAVAHLEEVHWAGRSCGNHQTLCSLWSEQRSFHLLLLNIRPLPEPVPSRGMQGLWSLPHLTERMVREQLAKVAAA